MAKQLKRQEYFKKVTHNHELELTKVMFRLVLISIKLRWQQDNNGNYIHDKLQKQQGLIVSWCKSE